MRPQIAAGCIGPSRERLQPLLHRAEQRQIGQQPRDRLSNDFRARVAENTLAGRVEDFHGAVGAYGDDHVLDVVEYHLPVAGIDPTQAFTVGARLIGNQLHRTHDAAPLVIELLVVAAD